jgi:hypothetical protein
MADRLVMCPNCGSSLRCVPALCGGWAACSQCGDRFLALEGAPAFRPGWPGRLKTLGVSVLLLFVLGTVLSAWLWLQSPAARPGAPQAMNPAVVYGGRPLLLALVYLALLAPAHIAYLRGCSRPAGILAANLVALCLGIWGWLSLWAWVSFVASTKSRPVGQALPLDSPLSE